MSTRGLAALGFALVVAGLAGGCAKPLGVGEFGRFRVVGQGRIEQENQGLPLLPPVSDRMGNVYILYNAKLSLDIEVFVGRAAGGWYSGCRLTKGDQYQVHGWLGYSTDRQFYWAGDALVAVSGRTGDCRRILNRDPTTSTDLLFRAIFPLVQDTPSRTTVPAIVQSLADPIPYMVTVDLLTGLYVNALPFDPPEARRVEVIGVGADYENRTGIVLLKYELQDGVHAEARFVAPGDDTFQDPPSVEIVSLPFAKDITRYAVQGFLQAGSNGTVAGVLDSGQVIAFNHSSGALRNITSMKAYGVHNIDGTLWLVGTKDNHPVIAELDAGGNAGSPTIWSASEATAAALEGEIGVVDDRTLPSRQVVWTSPKSAVGPFPFVSPWSPDSFATATTLWLFTGPTYNTGGDNFAQFAVAPVGISYP